MKMLYNQEAINRPSETSFLTIAVVLDTAGDEEPTFYLAQNDRLIRFNHAAKTLLYQDTVFQLRDGNRLAPISPNDEFMWRKTMAKTNHSAFMHAILLEGREKTYACTISVGEESIKKVRIESADRSFQQGVQAFATAYGLTSAEAAVLAKLSIGHRPKGIAIHFQRSETTIRTHIRKILNKANIHSIHELICGISRLPRA
jgi:DNA-binding CsgD family transcriptional regulator